jgi:ElaB/YqjD/DUF883 family membrane-anchored ribosome-binding protein
MALAGPKSANKNAVASELQYLLDLVQNVEASDYEAATKTLTHRKNKLMKAKMQIVNLADTEYCTPTDENKDTCPAQCAEDADDYTAENPDCAIKAEEPAEPKDDEPKEDPPKEETVEYCTPTDENKDTCPAQCATDSADYKAENPDCVVKASGSKNGAIIGGVVVAGLLIGGCVYYQKSKSDNEGGAKEDKTLFKKQFKGNVVKKVQKEALVPTFAVPAEENI